VKILSLSLFILFTLAAFTASASEGAKEQNLFGPKKYDVIERYGIENRYKETFKASNDLYFVKIQNGEKPRDASDYIDFAINGQKLVRDDHYAYPFIACVTKLQQENSFELMLRDVKPIGEKRPVLPPRFVFVSVLPMPIELREGVYGVVSWDQLQALAGYLKKIDTPASAELAVTALDLKLQLAVRAEATRKLAALKDKSARDLLTFLYADERLFPDIRVEAALALGQLGDKDSLPLLMQGVLHNQEKIRIASARGLSYYPAEDTDAPFTEMLRRIDPMRLNTVIQSIGDSGWKPLRAFIALAESKDPYISKMGIKLLGTAQDPEAAKYLLALLKTPREGVTGTVILSLAHYKDNTAVEALSSMAADPAARAGYEAELGDALASSGDKRFASLIGEMIEFSKDRKTRRALRAAYRKLTGTAYKAD